MSSIWDNYLDGSLENYNKVMSEKSLDDVISLLDLDPDKIVDPENGRSLKESLWNELATIIYVWGRPPETTLKTTPKHLLEHTTNIEKTLSKALEELEKIENNAMSPSWLKTKEMIVAELVIDKADDPNLFINEMSDVKQRLQKILAHTSRVTNDLKQSINKRGASKPSKDMHDRLIWELCKVYKRYTGRQPVSWNTGTATINSNQFTGDILCFLQGVLSNSFYSGEISPDALQKKIYRMKNHKEYGKLWQDTKK